MHPPSNLDSYRRPPSELERFWDALCIVVGTIIGVLTLAAAAIGYTFGAVMIVATIVKAIIAVAGVIL